MEMETLLAAAIQSSFLLGLLHGVNPCGHSWLVLAPFISGERKGSRVTMLTIAFLTGTALACLMLGATLGTVSGLMPASAGTWVEAVTSGVLIVIGFLLLYNPHILHNHDHHHDHDHHHGHDDQHHHHHDDHHGHHHLDDHDRHHESHEHGCHSCGTGENHGKRAWVKRLSSSARFLPMALFVIGFVNMIVPCPTAAVMYGYALNSGSTWTATVVFGAYAASTALAVGGVIYLIFKATSMASNLQKDWVEPLIMRLSGVIIILFSGYGLYGTFI